MSLDHFCRYFVIGLLPILFLPVPGLWLAMWIGASAIGLGLYQKQLFTVLLGGLWLLSYGEVLQCAYQAHQIPSDKIETEITITQLLKQQDYQTAIAETIQGERIYLNWQAQTPLQLEVRYLAQLQRRPISSRLNEGNFNRQRWYFAQKIDYTATVKQAQMLPATPGLRSRWLARVQAQTADLPQQGLLLALGFGERAWLASEAWEIFQATTTAHLIAISGLHIGLAFAIGFALARFLLWSVFWLSRPESALPAGFKQCITRRQADRFSLFFTKGVGLLFACGYSFLAGFSIPTLRALLAIVIVLACQFARRHYTPWQFWWCVVALLLLLDPFTLLSDSFWLSVLAVATLIVWYQFFPLSRFYELPLFFRLYRLYKKNSKTYRLLMSLCHLQLGIWLLFTPIQFWFFEGTSPFAFVANLVIVPLYSFVLVPLIFVSLLSDNLLHSWWLANWVAEFSLWFLSPMSDYWITLSRTQQLIWTGVHLTLLLILYGLLNYPPASFWRRLFYLPIGYTLLLWLMTRFSAKAEWIHFDVGQGLATALIWQDSAIIYDAGAAWKGGSMAELEVIPYLKRRGIEPEAIFISHDDNDHIGGLVPLQKAFPKAHLISSSKKRDSEANYEVCELGKTWQFNDIQIQAIAPITTVERAKNDDSCVLLVNIGDHKLLWTGDSGVAQEQQFLRQLGKIDFLQVGHHGSKTSTSAALLAQTQPSWAFISAGRWNPWKLPNKEVVQRLKQYQAKVVNTAEVGMIRVKFYENSYEVHTARSPLSPWYSQFFGQ